MPKTPDYFAGKTIVITGAASGIGRATALIFAREGANVVCADINEDGARETGTRSTARAARRSRSRSTSRRARRSTPWSSAQSKPSAACNSCSTRPGRRMRRAKFLDIDDDLLERTFDLNVKGTFYGMQAVLPHMLKNKPGVIVNMASMAHRRGGPGSSIHYAAAKGAVVSMTMGVAREFATQGIRALSISPGPVKTPFQDAAQSRPSCSAISRRRADEALRRAGRDRRAGAVHVLGRLQFHDRGHGLCERRRRLALSAVCNQSCGSVAHLSSSVMRTEPPYSAAMAAQQVIALQTELQRPKPL